MNKNINTQKAVQCSGNNDNKHNLIHFHNWHYRAYLKLCNTSIKFSSSASQHLHIFSKVIYLITPNNEGIHFSAARLFNDRIETRAELNLINFKCLIRHKCYLTKTLDTLVNQLKWSCKLLSSLPSTDYAVSVLFNLPFTNVIVIK